MADTEKTSAMLLDELAALDPVQRREVARELRNLSETFAEVPDGKTASYVFGVLAHLLDCEQHRSRPPPRRGACDQATAWSGAIQGFRRRPPSFGARTGKCPGR